MATAKLTLKGNQKPSKGFLETNSPKMDLTVTYLDPAALNEGFEESRHQIAHKREENNQRRIKHEQRRRKYVRLLDSSQIAHSRSFFEDEVIGRVLTKAECEKDEENLKKEVMAFKDIIELNRRNRDKRMEEMVANQGMHDVAWESVEAKREVQWTVFLDTNTQYRRREATNNAQKFAIQKDISGMVKDFLGKVLDGVDWVLTYREMTGIADHRNPSDMYSTATAPEYPVIPALLWADIKHAVVYNGPFPQKLPTLTPVLPSRMLVPFNVSERPLCADSDWLTEQVFTSSYIYDGPQKSLVQNENNSTSANDIGAIAEGSESDAAAVSRPLTANPSQQTVASSVNNHGNQKMKATSCSGILAEDDWSQHVSRNIREATSTHQSQSHRDNHVSQEDVEPPTHDTFETPRWLYDTPPTHLVSESVIAVRCVTEPPPEEPLPIVDTSHIAMRIALFGSSLTLRHKMRDALVTAIPRLAVISVVELLAQIVAKYTSNGAEETEEDALAKEIWSLLQQGLSVTDALYVQLIMREIQRIPRVNNGFVLVDFPTSKEQCLLLMEAFSGIRYDQPRPQPADYLSRYAALDTAVHWQYSIDRAGIDVLLCTDYPGALGQSDSGTDTGHTTSTVSQQLQHEQELSERFIQDVTHRRINMYTQEPVLLSATQTTSVRHLCQATDPAHPLSMVGVDSTFQRREVQEIAQLATYLHAFEDMVTVSGSSAHATPSPSPPSAAADGQECRVLGEHLVKEEIASLSSVKEMSVELMSHWCEYKAQSLRQRYIPTERWSEAFWQLHDLEEQIEALATSEAVLPVAIEACLVDASEDICERVVVMACDEDAAVQEQKESETATGGVTGGETHPTASATHTTTAAATAEGHETHTETHTDQDGGPHPSSTDGGYPYPTRTPQHTPSDLLLKKHALVLDRLWSRGEEESTTNGEDFFVALRDIRCQALQRNRLLLDVLQTFLLRDDRRQEYLSVFCQRFNDDIPDELRFDPDCVAELSLRTLLLRDFFCKLSEEKWQEAQAMVAKWSQDGICAVWQYRVQCEASALLQAELQRFYLALDVLFDTSKAYQGFPVHVRVRNDLEPVLPTVIVDTDTATSAAAAGGGKNAKDAGKKDAAKPAAAAAAGKAAKGNDKNGAGVAATPMGSMAQFVPYREAVAPMVLPVSQMTSRVPQPPEKEPSDADEKGKGKAKPPAKPKKGEEVNTGPFDPFAETWKAIQEELSKWQEGKFVLNRDLYYASDEALCVAVEKAVWYEAEKFLLGGNLIAQYVQEHLTWLQANETDLLALLTRLSSDRFTRELRATQGVVDLLQHTIQEATRVGDLWLVTSDAFPTINPETVWRPFASALLPTDWLAAYETPGGLSHHQKQRQVSFQKLRSSSMRLSFQKTLLPQQAGHPGGGGGGGGGVSRHSRTMSLRGSMSSGFNRKSLLSQVGGDTAVAGGVVVEDSLPVSWQESHPLVTRSSSSRASFLHRTQAMLQQRYQERYDTERSQLVSRLQALRHQREAEYEAMGLTPTAATLAAFNELLLDEQHALSDLQAKYAMYWAANNETAETRKVELRPQSRHAIVPHGEDTINEETALDDTAMTPSVYDTEAVDDTET